MKNIKRKAEIVAVLILALTISVMTGRLFFINNTPRLATTGIASFSRSIIAWVSKTFPANTARTTQPGDEAVVFNRLEGVPFSEIAQGVSARETSGVSEIRYEVDKVAWKEYSFRTREGKAITLRIPAEQSPPPQTLIDLLY